MNAHQDGSGVPLTGVNEPIPPAESDSVQYLLELVGEEPRALTDLQFCVDRLAQAQRAKQSLATVPAAALRAAIAARGSALGGQG